MMGQYLCQLCYKTVTYDEKHQCLYQDNLNSVSEHQESIKEKAKLSIAKDKLFDSLFTNIKALRNDSIKSQILDSLPTKDERLALLRIASKVKRKSNSRSNKSMDQNHQGNHSAHLENLGQKSFDNHLQEVDCRKKELSNASEADESESRPQVKIYGASKRKSKPTKLFREPIEKIECSFQEPNNEKSVVTKGNLQSLTDDEVLLDVSQMMEMESKNIFEASDSLYFDLPCEHINEKKERNSGENDTIRLNSLQGISNGNVLGLANNLIPNICSENTGNLSDQKYANKDNNELQLNQSLFEALCNKSAFNITDITPPLVSARSSINTEAQEHPENQSTICCICGRNIPRNWNLAAHYRIHFGLKPFFCDQCGRQFDYKTNFDRHTLIHTGEKQYACESCGKAFNQKSNLKKHFQTHTGEKPFACHLCQRRFTTKFNLTIHTRSHTGEKPFECHECDKRFSTKYVLIKHLRNHIRKKMWNC